MYHISQVGDKTSLYSTDAAVTASSILDNSITRTYIFQNRKAVLRARTNSSDSKSMPVARQYENI